MEEVREGIDRLIESRTGRFTIMCSEAVWWRSHRPILHRRPDGLRLTSPVFAYTEIAGFKSYS
ncbi:MAG: DUF488 domain-containing protein [Mesorhizobium sp.]|nr:MAG: DUF488 domain-containing protein [Mesorhizobium sp.]